MQKQTLTETFSTTDSSGNTTTGTAKIKAVFPNTDNSLFPNQFVNVRLIIQDRQDAIVVPSAALQAASSGNFLYVVRQGTPPPGYRKDADWKLLQPAIAAMEATLLERGDEVSRQSLVWPPDVTA